MQKSRIKFLATPVATVAAILITESAHASVFLGPNINAATVFRDGLGETTMTLAYDGSSYWSASGGSCCGLREARYDSAGAFQSTFSTSLDFRSIFTDASGNVYARQYASSTIYKQTSPGVFASQVSLVGGSLDDQSSVVLNGAGTEYIAMGYGFVERWDLSGAHLGSVSLSGFGTQGAESFYPQGRGIAAVGNYWLTYDGSGTLSAWDFSGNRTDTTVLNGSGVSFDSNFSLSYANGQAFIVDYASGNWRGYEVLAPVPEPSTYIAGAMLALVFGVQGVRSLRSRKQVA